MLVNNKEINDVHIRLNLDFLHNFFIHDHKLNLIGFLGLIEEH